MNVALFDSWQGWPQFPYLLGIIVVAMIFVRGAIPVARSSLSPAQDIPQIDPKILFLRRVLLNKRGPLLRLEAPGSLSECGDRKRRGADPDALA